VAERRHGETPDPGPLPPVRWPTRKRPGRTRPEVASLPASRTRRMERERRADLSQEAREAWNIARLLSAPLPVCPYSARFADDDPDHPCHAMCREEC
jgi:hypothetical protein